MSAKAAKKKKASAKTSDEVEEKEVVAKEAPKAKKAKKAKSEVTDEQTTAEKTTEEPQVDLAKKKKKKKKASEDTAEKPDDAQPTELAAKKKKKKKKKEEAEDEEETTTQQEETTAEKEDETGGDFDFTKKKKKKKKKEVQEEDNEKEEAEAVPETPTKPQLKSALSQKSLSSITKKKVKIAAEFAPEDDKKDDTPEAEGEPEPEDVTKDEDFDYSNKRKKKKKKKGTPEPVEELEEPRDIPEDDENDDVTFAAAPNTTSTVKSTWTDSDRDYEYTELLSTIYGLLNQNNPELLKLKNKFVIRPPDVLREGTKKTVWANFQEICDQMHRQSDHVLSYARAELGTSASVDGNFRLTIKGRFQPKQIESVVRHYINEYVTCRTCRSPDTLLKKENRLNFIQCKACGSTRSVAPIKQGFVAQVDKRKKA